MNTLSWQLDSDVTATHQKDGGGKKRPFFFTAPLLLKVKVIVFCSSSQKDSKKKHKGTLEREPVTVIAVTGSGQKNITLGDALVAPNWIRVGDKLVKARPRCHPSPSVLCSGTLSNHALFQRSCKPQPSRRALCAINLTKKCLANSKLARTGVLGLPTRPPLTGKEDRVNYSLMAACRGATFTHFCRQTLVSPAH